MRTVALSAFLITAGLTTGCITDRKPYANNPLLLYYKPTLSDSDTVLAQREPRTGPTQPPMPALAADSPKDMSPFSPPTRLPASPVLPAKFEIPASPPPPAIIQPILRQASEQSKEQPPEPLKPLYSELSPIAPPAPPKLPSADFATPTSVEPSPTIVQNLSPVESSAKKSGDIPPSGPPALQERRSVPGRYGHDAAYHWLQGVVEKDSHGHNYIRYCDPSLDDEFGGKFIVDDPRLAEFHDGDVIGVSGELVPVQGPGERNRKYTIREAWLVKAKQ